MIPRTMHQMGGHAAGATRLGSAPTTLHASLAYDRVDRCAASAAVAILVKPWNEVELAQALPVFTTDRPTRRPFERSP